MDKEQLVQQIYDHLEADRVESALMDCLRLSRSIKDHLNTATFLWELFYKKNDVVGALHGDVSDLTVEAQTFVRNILSLPNVLGPIRCALGTIASVTILAGCATPYQPMGALGGYQEERLAPDIYRVAFYGNGYTNPQTAAEYVHILSGSPPSPLTKGEFSIPT
jgi:hypothetical protein